MGNIWTHLILNVRNVIILLGIAILSGFIQGSMTLKGRSLSVTLLVVEGSTILKAISMNIRGSTHGRSPPSPHCGKDFSGMYWIKSHLLSCPSTPGGVPEKRFQCEICNKAYYRQAELTRHQKSKGH